MQASTQDTLTPTLGGVAHVSPMRAVVYDAYGSFDGLSLRDIAVPSLDANQVLVRVSAAALHVGDCFTVRGVPFPVRFMSGLVRPKYGVPGFDLAGTVETVGANVKRFKPGDHVFGAGLGSCAEYVRAPEEHLADKPAAMSFEHAAGLTTSGLAALHALRDVAKLQPGQKILINGASGGVGHFAVQIAKSYGAEVTGVCSSANAAMVRALGADHIIDYTQEDFTRGEQRYDVVLDNVENRQLAECRRVLTPTGLLILNSGTGATGLAMFVRLLKPLVLSPFVKQNLRRYLSTPNHADLLALKQLVDAGKLTTVLDRTFALHETADALRHIEAGHARGKVIVLV